MAKNEITFEMMSAGVEAMKEALAEMKAEGTEGNVAYGYVASCVYLAMKAAQPTGAEAAALASPAPWAKR